jgi:hypothetical protein
MGIIKEIIGLGGPSKNELKSQLEEIRQKTGWIDRNETSRTLPEKRISDGEFVKSFAEEFGLSNAEAKRQIDWIEKKIPEMIKGGKCSLRWQGLGTFYAVLRDEDWRPRVRFHKAFIKALNRK